MGATDAFTQASILTLYDPDRSQSVRHNGAISGWGPFINAMAGEREGWGARRGAGVRILTGTVTSPTLASQLDEFLKAFPEAKWHQWEPCARHAANAGAMAAFGSPMNAIYRFDRAGVVVSLDADFLCSTMPGSLKYARDFSARRRAAAEGGGKAPRLYMAESSPSITGGMADHRYRMKASGVAEFGRTIADAGSALGRDLEANRGSSLVIAGEYQPPSVHALAHSLNRKLGNVGETVLYTDPVEVNPTDQVASLRELVNDMNRGSVQVVIMLGGNPAYDAPADFGFLDALKKVRVRAHLGVYANETAQWCHWHVPQAHYLESWSDGRGYDGTASIVQPLILPLYGAKTSHEVMSVLNGHAGDSAHDTVKDYWRAKQGGAVKAPAVGESEEFRNWWRTSLHDGVIAGSAFATKMPPEVREVAAITASTGMEIVFRPDPSVGDGAYSNNAWLQEMPKPQNKMTWDNAVWVSPKTARAQGLNTGDVVELGLAGRKVSGPVWIMPGQADDCFTVHFGYGRTGAGRVADGVGFDVYALRASDALHHAVGVTLTRKSHGYSFATTQHTQTMEERDPFRITAYGQQVPREIPEQSMFPQWNYDRGHKWGMAIDLNSCVGCNACTIACQAENNISVVGKEEVAKGRHMNWIRVDRYFEGSLDDPKMYFQPVPCMHCENALCELVCPVAATVHSVEGLNEMVYNRCVGTRYCSNNCPYKVRRFNFLLYADWNTESLYGGRNPDVSVRSRGVMEKCTYCVQRINERKIQAEKEDRPLRDGEIVTACQQSCPTQAIVFGDINDPQSRVSRMKSQQRNYGLLEDLNTRPRTTYLSRLRNPNSEIEKA